VVDASGGKRVSGSPPTAITRVPPLSVAGAGVFSPEQASTKAKTKGVVRQGDNEKSGFIFVFFNKEYPVVLIVSLSRQTFNFHIGVAATGD
jgi:hypothetical protein